METFKVLFSAKAAKAWTAAVAAGGPAYVLLISQGAEQPFAVLGAGGMFLGALVTAYFIPNQKPAE